MSFKQQTKKENNCDGNQKNHQETNLKQEKYYEPQQNGFKQRQWRNPGNTSLHCPYDMYLGGMFTQRRGVLNPLLNLN
jgi:hypothetical protein